MKKTLLVVALGLAAGAAMAQESGRVISSVPVIQQVAVPRQVCNQAQVIQPAAPSGGGAAIGAVVGGLLGNTIGHGMGRAAATGVGVVAGAAVGNSVEGRGQVVQPVQQCSTQTYYENRTVGYNVTYEYAGKQYQTQMPYDPGPNIRLQVTPMGAGAPMGPNGAPPIVNGPMSSLPPTIDAPVTVMASPAVVPVAYAYDPGYYYRPYYPPVGVSLSLGYSSGWGGHHHHHWR